MGSKRFVRVAAGAVLAAGTAVAGTACDTSPITKCAATIRVEPAVVTGSGPLELQAEVLRDGRPVAEVEVDFALGPGTGEKHGHEVGSAKTDAHGIARMRNPQWLDPTGSFAGRTAGITTYSAEPDVMQFAEGAQGTACAKKAKGAFSHRP